MQEVLKSVDNLRYKADSLIQNAVICKKTAETTLAWRSLQMAKSWLGKFKGELGAQSPYLPATEVAKIPPTAEVYEGELIVSNGGLQDLNIMRQEIESMVISIGHAIPNEYVSLSLAHAIQHLSEARFWYGFELANLREKALVS